MPPDVPRESDGIAPSAPGTCAAARCAILANLNLRSDRAAPRLQALTLSRRRRHRGRDRSGVWANDRAILGRERIAIVGVAAGAQPLLTPDGEQVPAVHGEIDNHRALRAPREANYAFATHHDSCTTATAPARGRGAPACRTSARYGSDSPHCRTANSGAGSAGA